MNRFLATILRRRGMVLTLAALAAAVGLWSWRRLPVDAFPDVTNVQVMVLAKAPGLAAEDVERRVTWPVEQRLGGLPRLQLVRSLSRAGLSQVVAVFRDGTDPYFARQQVFERLAGAREELPPGVEPELAPLSTGLGEIFQYTVEGDSLSLAERRAIQDWLVAPRLRAVRGVTEVNSFGGFVRQVHVLVRPERLVKYGLTLRDVEEAVARANDSVGAGTIVRGWEQYAVLGRGLFRDASEVGDAVLLARDGTPVLLRDVADVVEASETRQGAVTRDGRGETVAGMVIMLRGENGRTVVQAVKDAVARIQTSLPAGARLSVFYDRTELIEACVRTVTDALLQGGLFVILVLFLFLAELRTAVVVLLSLPITYLYTFIVMQGTGLTANLMTLGGLAFSVGMVVDASIVVVEVARRRLAEAGGGPPARAAIQAAVAEVARPVTFSVLVIALVLAPLLTLQGIEGKMFRPLALALMFSLLTSLVVALVVMPPLSSLLLSRRPPREFGFVRRLHAHYLRVLAGALDRSRLALAATVAVLLAGGFLATRLGREFIPALDEGAIAVNAVRLPDASLEGSVAVARVLEERLRRFPEVATVVSKTGRAEISEDPMGPEQSDLFIMLRPRRDWPAGRGKPELVEAIAAELAAVPGLRFSFSQPIALRVNELISGVKSDLAVKIFGPDLALLKERADRVAAVLGQVPGARDVKVEQVAGMTQLEVETDRAAAARYGLGPAEVNATLETAFAGRTVTTLVEGERRVAVVVRLPEESRRGVADLERLLVAAPDGSRVPLGAVARIVQREGPAQISRENGQRRVTVEANVRGRDLGGFVAEVQERLAEIERSLPAGAYIVYGGQFENQQRAMRQLAIVVPVALGLILVLLYSALGSARNALLVVLNLPFALVGGVAAAVAFGLSLSVSAAVAFIVLLGVAVQNGVVLVAYLHQLRAQGRPPREAVLEGCDVRFRPLLMTALTSFIGHLPMLFATGSGADIQKPLAVVVMGGLVTSTLLTQLVVPLWWYRLESGGSPGSRGA